MARRGRGWMVVACVCLSFALTSPAAAQDPPLEQARVEGTFTNGEKTLRLTAPCATGPCAPTGVITSSDRFAFPKGATPVTSSSGAGGYRFSATHNKANCGGELVAKVTWTATLQVEEAAYIDGVWRATRLVGEERIKHFAFDGGNFSCGGVVNEFPIGVSLQGAQPDAGAVPPGEPDPTAGSGAGEGADGAGGGAAAGAEPDGDPASTADEQAATAAEVPLFARSVAAPSEASTDRLDLLRSLLLVVLLMLLIVFPSHLFNSTLEGNYDEIRGWFRRKNRPAATDVEPGRNRRLHGWPAFLTFTIVSSILYGFLDPAFGLNRGSALQLTILVVSTVILTLVFAWPVRSYMRRSHGDEGFLQVLPGALLFAVLCVVASRLADFRPGYFYGLIAGFAFTRSLNRQEAGKSTALAAAFVLGLAVISWGVQGEISIEGAGLAPSLLRAVLGGLFVGGVEGLVFGLLPLRFLSGEKLWAWSKPMWAVLIGLALFMFVHILMDPESGYLADTGYTPVGTVIGFFAAFGIFSVAFWAFFRYRKAPAA